MRAKCYRRASLPLLFVAVLACNKAPTATQIMTDKMDQSKASRPAHWDYMVDNAMLQDMSLTDNHFIPHSDELNGTGTARLDRMVKILDTYGGTVRLETDSTDEAFTARRIDHAREYLAVAGCDMSRVKVAAMMSGGRGMPAEQAIQTVDRSREEKDSAEPAPLSFSGSSSENN